MTSIVVPPTATQPGVVIGDDHHNNRHYDHGSHGHYHPNNYDVSERITDAEQNVINIINQSKYDTAIAIEKVSAANLVTQEKIGAANQLTVEKISAATQLAIEKSRAEIQLQASIVGSKNELLAAQNFAAVLAELAKCCCEMKELVRSEGSAGRELAREIEARAVRDELVDAKLALALAKGK